MSEHAVIVHIPLQQGDFGSPEEQEAAFDLEGQLEDAVNAAGAGEFDGNEFGGGECVFYMYGPDADALFRSIEPVLAASAAASGGFAIKRYGEADDADAAEVRIPLA